VPGLLSTVDKQAKAVDTIRILILEDNSTDARLTLRKAKETGLEIAADVVGNSQQFIKYFQSQPYDLVLGDYRLPDWTGLDALRWLKNSGYDTPFILVTGTLGDELAVECMKEGANDYVLKDKLERLPFAIHRALEEHRVRVDRDRAERDLRQSEEQFRSIVKGAPFGICQMDEHGQIRIANPALVEMLGYASESELLAVDTVHQIGRGPSEMQRTLAAFENQPSSAGPELTWRQKSGKEIFVRLGGTRVRATAGSNAGYNIFVEDVTQQRALERQFQHSQKMEAIGRLAGGVAHDFNNLLMVIGASADFAGQHKNNPEKIGKYLRQIQEATSIATSVTRQLLMFSRKQVLERHVQDLNSIVSDMSKMLPRLLGEDVKLVIRLGPDLPKVNVDRGHVEQVIMNLTVNARDAMPTGGNLLVETTTLTVDDSIQPQGLKLSPGSYVTLRVQDSGIGMNEETKTQIFEPFFTTKERGKGTGLGLSTVYGLVEQNRGKIWVESELGKGSTFTVYFPSAEGPVQVQPRVQRTKSFSNGSETVLYVEDEAALRDIVCESLEASGFTVLSAANGNEALDLCRTHQGTIDVLVTDLVMPGMPGIQLAQRALELHPGLRVIYVSGYTEHPMDLQNLGPRAVYLQKPFDIDALVHQIRSFFRRTA